MAWESRAGSGRYYTRSRRVGGVVIREYIGAGTPGEKAHQTDVEERLERAKKRNAFEAARLRDAELDETIGSLVEVSDSVARGLLILAGFRQYNRGEWRRTDGQQGA